MRKKRVKEEEKKWWIIMADVGKRVDAELLKDQESLVDNLGDSITDRVGA